MSNVIEHEIQVSGNECFSAFEWTDAVNYYLEGVRTNDWAVMYRPKIFFGGITLRREDTEYCVYDVAGSPDQEVPAVQGPAVLMVTCENNVVEDALRRLVHTAHLTMIVISFRDGATLYLWKKEDGSYGVHAKGAGSFLPV